MAQTAKALSVAPRIPIPTDAIALDSIVHVFGPRIILNRLNLQIAAGELFVILGESGSGKSTLLRLLAGLDTPKTGAIRMLGTDQRGNPAHHRPVSLVTQSAGCYDHLTVRENLDLARRLAAADARTNADSRTMEKPFQSELIERFGLNPHMSNRAAQLSGGERQRLALARALLIGRPILLLDEPLAHLNESLRESLRNALRTWTKRLGITTLYVTHDSMEASDMADRIGVLCNGRFEQIDAPKQLYDAPKTPRVALLFGKPCMQLFPLEGQSGDRLTGTLGVRPCDWKANAIDGDPALYLHLGDGPNRPQGIGRIASARRVEGSLWLEIHVGQPEPLRIVIPSFDAMASDATANDSITRDLPTNNANCWVPGTCMRLEARRWHYWSQSDAQVAGT